MAFLDQEVLEVGRGHLRDGNLDAFIAWADEVPVHIDLEYVRMTMGRCMESGDTSQALKLFEAVWPATDPVADAWVRIRGATILVTVIALVVFGLLGGVVYFFRALS